ncbi:MAG: hypothetical protein ABSH09_10110 [Bryobacteraceae bacterium]|jgi:hypothetical protein
MDLRNSSLWRLVVAVGLTAIQVSLAMAVAQSHPAEVRHQFAIHSIRRVKSYESVCAGDCFWYASIAREGYHSSIPPEPPPKGDSNVAFFPGFPLLVRAAHAISQLDWPASAVLASQIATVGFWFMLLQYLEAVKIPPTVAGFAVLAVFSHPASLYLVDGYSESLYLLATISVLWCGEKAVAFTWIPGAAAIATRVLGFPLAIYSAIRAIAAPPPRRRVWIANALLTCIGGLPFFIYCQVRFGHWDLYFQTQHAGWGHVPDYWFFTRAAAYQWSAPWRKPMLITGEILYALVITEWLMKTESGDRERAWARRAMLSIALAQLYLGGASMARNDGEMFPPFVDFTRYSYPMALLAVLVAADQWRSLNPAPLARRAAAFGLALVCLASLIFLNLRGEAAWHLR